MASAGSSFRRWKPSTGASIAGSPSVSASSPAGYAALLGGEASKSHRMPKPMLLPDPIMSLKQVIGFSGDKKGCLLWSTSGEEVVFPCANTVVAMSLVDSPAAFSEAMSPLDYGDIPDTPASSPRRMRSRPQRHFIGHTDDVCCLGLSNDGTLLVSGQSGDHPSIRVWAFSTQTCLAILAGHSSNLGGFSFSLDDSLLCAHGLDSHSRLLLVVWDVSRISEGHHAVVARQVADFPVNRICFSPYDNERLVSCGRENIRFWRIKRGHLPGCPVILNEYARGCEFTDLAFESSYGPQPAEFRGQRRVFIASANGNLMQVNYDTRALECVFRLHDGPIHSVAVNEGFCVTGSADNFLRVWPLDFSDYHLEAQHEGAVTSCAVSPDGLKIGVGTAVGSVGVLDIASHAFHTLLRSHTDEVLAVAVRPNVGLGQAEFTTVSRDATIRVWNAASGDQVCEFNAPDEISHCVAYHPKEHILACGFDNGCVRIFDVASASVIEEYQQHRGPVRQVCFHPDGVFLYSAGGDGYVYCYDGSQAYTPVKAMASDVSGDALDAVATMALSPDGSMLAASFSVPLPADLPSTSEGLAKLEAVKTIPGLGSSPVVLMLDPTSLQVKSRLQVPAPARPSRPRTHVLPAALSLPVSSSGLVATVAGSSSRSGGMKPRSSSGVVLRHGPSAGGISGRVFGSDAPEEWVPPPQLTSLNFTPDSEHLAACTSDRRVVRWETASSEVLRIMKSVHQARPSTASISPNGLYLATGADDNIIKIWDFEEGNPPPAPFQSFVGHSGPIRGLAFLGDGRSVLSAGGKGAFFVWSFAGDAGPFMPKEPYGNVALEDDYSSPSESTADSNGPGAGSPTMRSATASGAGFAPGAGGASAQPYTNGSDLLGNRVSPIPVQEGGSPQDAADHRAGDGGEGDDDIEGGVYDTEDADAASKLTPANDSGERLPGEAALAPAEVGDEVAELHHSKSRVNLLEGTGLSHLEVSAARHDRYPGEEHAYDMEAAEPTGTQAGAVSSSSADGGDIWDSSDDGNGEGNTSGSGSSGSGSSERREDSSESRSHRVSERLPSQGGFEETVVEPDQERVIGIETRVQGGLIWNPAATVFGYVNGSRVVLEDLATKGQTFLEGTSSLITAVSLAPDASHLAAGFSPDGESGQCLATYVNTPSEESSGESVWQSGGLLTFNRGATMPILCLAYSPDSRFLAAVGQPGTTGLRVIVAVWDTTVDTSVPVAQRDVVLGAVLLDDGLPVVADMDWTSRDSFVVVGACGAVEFTFDLGVASVVGTSVRTTATLNHRTVISPDQLRSGDEGEEAGLLTCIAPQMEAPSSGGQAAILSLSEAGGFAIGDSLGSIYILRKDFATASHSITKISPSWSAHKGASAPSRSPIGSLCWRGSILVGANHDGLVVAWKLEAGSELRGGLAVRGVVNIGDAVTDMVWDAHGLDGVVLSSTGSVWFARWGAAPCRLCSAHTSTIRDLATCDEAPYVFVSAGGKDGSARVWETNEWSQVLALGDPSGAPVSAVALCQAHQPRDSPSSSASAEELSLPAEGIHALQAVVGFEDGALRTYSLSSASPLVEVQPHGAAVTKVAWISSDEREAESGAPCRAFVSGDASGRVYVTPVEDQVDGAAAGTPVRLDKAVRGAAQSVAASHKFHAVVSVDVNPFDPSTFLVATANGRVSVWRCSWFTAAAAGSGDEGSRHASLSFEMLGAVVVNFAVDDPPSPWVSLVGPGSSSDVPALACFSPVQPTVIVCTGGTTPDEVAPHSLFYYCVRTQRVLQKCLFPEAALGLRRVAVGGGTAQHEAMRQHSSADMSFVAVSTPSQAVYLHSCHPESLGNPQALIPSGDDGEVAATVAVLRPATGTAHLVTASGPSLHVWSFADGEHVVEGGDQAW